MGTYGPQVTLTRLFRKMSKAGGSYFTGVMGGAKVLLLKSKDTTEEGGEIWNLVVQERPPKGDGIRSGSRPSQGAPDGNGPQGSAKQHSQAPALTDRRPAAADPTAEFGF